MGSNTSRLNLYKSNPVTDGENTFNVDTLMNENWDKIDANVAKLTDIPTIPTSLPANGGNSTTVNNHTAAATPATTEQIDLVGMVNEVNSNLTSHKDENASLTQTGHVQLQTTIDTSESKALTPKALNNHQIDYTKHSGYAVTSGTSTAYTIALNPAPTVYADGQQFIINPHVDCGATPTLNVCELGALAIVKQDGSTIAAGDIKANKPLSLVRVGSNFFIRSSGGSNIKSIQRILLTSWNDASTTKDLTISSVNINNTIVLINTKTGNGSAIASMAVSLVDSTTVRVIRNTSGNPGIVTNITVIEFNNVKSKQTGIVTLNQSVENIVTISSVNIDKSLLFVSLTCSYSDSNQWNFMVSNAIKDSTTLSFYTNAATGYDTVYWQVIEFN